VSPTKTMASKSLEPTRTHGSGVSSDRRGGTPTYDTPCKFPPINLTSKSIIYPPPVCTEDRHTALQSRARNPNKRSTAPIQIKRKEFATVAVSNIKSCENFDESPPSRPMSKADSIEMPSEKSDPVDELPKLASNNFLSNPNSPETKGERPMSFGKKNSQEKSLLPPRMPSRQNAHEYQSDAEGEGSQRFIDSPGKNFHVYQMEKKTEILLNASGMLEIEGFSKNQIESSGSIQTGAQGTGWLAPPGGSPFKKSQHTMHWSMEKKVKNSQNAY
jgi:hypothetical protein